MNKKNQHYISIEHNFVWRLILVTFIATKIGMNSNICTYSCVNTKLPRILEIIAYHIFNCNIVKV